MRKKYRVLKAKRMFNDVELVHMHLRLSLNEYKTLGAPGVDEIVELTLRHTPEEVIHE